MKTGFRMPLCCWIFFFKDSSSDVSLLSVLYETGGVPFEILEPVLERCTPEQLLRIEEYNPVRKEITFECA